MASPQRVVHLSPLGRFGGPQPSKVNSYRPALPGGRGVCAPGRKHFLSIWRKRSPKASFFDMRGAAAWPLPLSTFSGRHDGMKTI